MSQGEKIDKSSINVDKGKNILIIVLVILVFLSGWRLLNDHREKSQKSEEIFLLSEENSHLNFRLDSMTEELTSRIKEIDSLGGDIEALVKVKEQLIKERKLDKSRSAKDIARLNAQIDSYLTLLEEKDADIVRLKAQNVQLFSENKELKTTKSEIEEEVVKLNIKTVDLENKVSIASRLKAENIVVAAVNSRGREREGEFRNRQLERLKISFNIGDNKVAEAGMRDVYVQVLSPNEQVIFDIAKGSGTFELDGKEHFYTSKQDFVFNNTRQQLTYFYEKGSDYEKGTYSVKIFSDGAEIGRSAFEIK
ncbi:hypothetical protein [Cyclobacterium amurskyense]|jgi:Tfp pilus assembly protein PilN|uniref:Uncharacterized protein n=1 Tax=Cyclobacterium amurskyense TaxID=320787 RepID=A0A0H4PKV7_9BACT|nr:hypothetical protein [Cyclobacterium amurskyense]AKP53675.1 hypothetical protein CA2015_4330 [Cyclobacterium amurskyense]|tara:strand:+ start:12851 stop:13774 length:924 start_codon:yes stop_codon:yes gene_type:complete